jgi:2-polyprenyl-3-methyl-5-hydroxy-6-metoxy-1,4-benzoquinol methylase
MGHLREKYTAEYYLHHDREGKAVGYGADGLEDFHRGEVRAVDRDILERIDFNGKRVLDIGCGRGEAVKYAAEHGAAEVRGVDFSEAAIAIARDFLRRSNVAAEVHCADALEFLRNWRATAGSAPLDVVMMLDCVEHIPRSELTSLLRTLGPLMARRGLLLVNTPAFGADNDVLVEGLKEDARDESDDFEATRGMHCNRYTCRSLKTYLGRLGFSAISHHLFVAHWRPPRFLEATRWARRKAAAMGYPILLPRALDPEIYGGPTRTPWRHHPALAPLRRLRRYVRSRDGSGGSLDGAKDASNR